MKSTKEISIENRYHKFMLIGAAGTGKSSGASTAPTPAFLFDFGREAISYRGGDFDYEDFPPTGRGYRLAEGMLAKLTRNLSDRGLPTLKDEETGEVREYQTVILDNTTALSQLALSLAMDLNPQRDEAGGPIFNIHYSMVSKLVHGFVRRFLELPCHRVVITHVEYFKDDNSGDIMAEPLLSGKLSYQLPTNFDEVYYSVVRQSPSGPEYFFQLINFGRYKARSRIRGKDNILPAFVPNDFDYILGKKKFDQEINPRTVSGADPVKPQKQTEFKQKDKK